MGKKTYFSKDKKKLSFSLDSKKNISFSNFGGSYSTSDAGEQKKIEASWYFKNGHIYLPDGDKELSDEDPNPGDKSYTSIEAVTTIQEARDVLKGEPYYISPQKLNTPNAIRAQAEIAGVSFPNLDI